MTWENVPKDITNYVGYVYEVSEIDTGMKYIGIKKFWEIQKLSALKTRTKVEEKRRDKVKNNPKLNKTQKKKELSKLLKEERKRRTGLKGVKRHVKKESDWRTYNTSSPILQEKIAANPSNYKKEILECCDSVTQMKTRETYIQLDYYLTGRWHKIYNEVINLRLRIPKKKVSK